MTVERKEFGIAPVNKKSEELMEKLDAAIVIPAMDEGIKIMDTIFSAVRQGKYKDMDVKYGIVVVINNRPNSGDSVKANNFLTYLFLQALEHKVPITLRGNENFNQKVKFIQDRNIPIHVIDAFSEKFAHPQSNVGRARRIGTELALTLLKPESFIVSTDADTRLSDLLMVGLKNMFQVEENIVGTRLGMWTNLSETNIDEKRASTANELYWKLLQCLNTDRAYVEDEFVWMAGGGSAFRTKNYKTLVSKGKGYLDVPGHEDTLLGSALADEGWVIRDMSERYPDLWVSTRQRFSQRASTGFGQRTLLFDQRKNAFKDIQMESVDYMEQKDQFLNDVQDIYFHELIPKYKRQLDKPIDDLYLVFTNSSIDNKFVNEFIEDTKSQAVERFIEICKKYNLGKDDTTKLVEAFKNWKPNQEMGLGHHDFIKLVKETFEKRHPKQSVESFFEIIHERILNNIAELENTIPSNYLEEQHPNLEWRYEDFEKKILQIVEGCGVDISNPDLLLKMRVSIVYNYKNFLENFMVFVQSEMLKIIKEELKEKGKDAHVDILNQTEIPRELAIKTVISKFLENIMGSVNDIRNTLMWDVTSQTSEKMQKEVYRLGDEMADYYRKHMKDEMEEFRRLSSEKISELQRKISKLEEEEREEKV